MAELDSPETRKPLDAHGDSTADASAHLMKELHDAHKASLARNSADSAQDVAQGINLDKSGIALAQKTMGLAEQLKQYLKGGGDFTDAQGKDLGQSLIASLRQERTNHLQDRSGAAEYAGSGIATEKQQSALSGAASIADAGSKLLDPATSDADKAALLEQIGQHNRAIAEAVDPAGAKNGVGKDQKDALAETKVIDADLAALKGANLTPEQRNQLYSDIASKAQLIKNEMSDVPNELGEIDHDNQAIKHGSKVEALLHHAMRHPHHHKAHAQLKDGLDQLTAEDQSGVLDNVVKDRKADMVKEPDYMAANARDNEQNNKKIIEFTSPFASKD